MPAIVQHIANTISEDQVNHQKAMSTKESSTIWTPLADKLSALKNMATASFHALPLAGGASIEHCHLRTKYENLFGHDYLSSDLTITGKNFDSLFFSKGVIREAEDLAARLYGADHTLFVTSGTTTSNQIAIKALCSPNARALMDKQCHQSIHFTLNDLNARVDHIDSKHYCEDSGRSTFDVNDLLAKILLAQNEGNPYELIVLTGHAYDGIVYNIPSILEFLLSNGVTTRRFIIDEAWGAANYFHEKLRTYSAMNIKHLRAQYPDLAIVSTQSAHKSLSCLRQASMIHFQGPQNLAEKLRVNRFRLHTTSPSYPILASLDLARAQMQNNGTALMQKANQLAAEFKKSISTSPMLSRYSINQYELPNHSCMYAGLDPLKISLNVSELAAPTSEIRDHLFIRYGIYVNRTTNSSLLFNFHIGIGQHVVNKLLIALDEIQRDFCPDWLHQSTAKSFIVPYPPGIPIALPGENLTPQLHQQIRDIARSGIQVFSI